MLLARLIPPKKAQHPAARPQFSVARCCVILLSALLLSYVGVSRADESQNVSSAQLKNDQLAISGRYDRFERLLSQMADILGHEDPERAELLRRAISKGREKAISGQLGRIASDLGDNNLGRALEDQEEVLTSISVLLQLLQSEDRRSELEKERERLNKLLNDLSNTLSEQQSARASTQNGKAPSSAAPAQQKAIDRADRILDDIRTHEGQSDGESGEGSSSEEESSSDNAKDSDSPEGKTANGERPENSEEAESSDSQQSPDDAGESEPSSAGNNSESKPSDDQPNDQESKQNNSPPSDSSDGQDSQQSQGSESPKSQNSGEQDEQESQETPGKPQVEEARRLMQESLEQLQKQLKEKALESQDGAINELRKAVDELRRKLLQLREEEKEMILASLEARFQRMLAQQTQVYDETVDLSATPVAEWLDTMVDRSRKVAQLEVDLQAECEQTLGLLREDGTSVAIVLSVEDISGDMQTVSVRLRQSKVGGLTQSLQTDIIEALKELIEATQREMQEMKSEERQQQQAQSGDQKKPPLVELAAEIKVLRSLQLRINRRTQRVDGLLADPSGEDRPALLNQLAELTSRQQRLVDSAEELAELMKR